MTTTIKSNTSKLDTTTIKKIALSLHLGGVNFNEIDECKYDETIFEYESEEWQVLTDEEADEKAKESAEYYIDECVLPEMPEHLRNYLDDESLIEDILMDGRGHQLSSYDGCEWEVYVETTEEWLYLYRKN